MFTPVPKKVCYVFQYSAREWFFCADGLHPLQARGEPYKTKRAALAGARAWRDPLTGEPYTHYRILKGKPMRLEDPTKRKR